MPQTVDDALRTLSYSISEMLGESHYLRDEVRRLKAELTKSVDVRLSERDGVIRALVAELRYMGYDITCEDDGMPMGWSRPEGK